MSFFAKLKTGLSKTSGKLGGGITDIFTKKKLDEDSLESLEELLIEADIGVTMAAELCASLGKKRFEKDLAPDQIRKFLADEVAAVLAPLAKPLQVDRTKKPDVIVMVGVNGNGKTTTIGKIASQFKAEGLKVMLAAADTFRAAAVEQLQVWGERSGIPVIRGEHEADPASVAFRAYEEAKAKGMDVLLIDTAGRLQNKANLMAELQKIIKTLVKASGEPPKIIQVLDATTGGNALSQVAAFKEGAQVSGLIITKLDGTAKGGIVVALARQTGLPLHAIGVGEGIDDLNTFDPYDFAANLVDLS